VLEIFGLVFLGISAETDPLDPPRLPGPVLHINFHEKSAPQTNSDAVLRHPKTPARLPSGTQANTSHYASTLISGSHALRQVAFT